MRKKKGKRPGGGKGRTLYDANTVERILVYGELSIDPDTKVEVLTYPTYQELGTRFGVTPQSIGAFSKRNNLLVRRREVEEGRIQKQVQKITRKTFDSARLPLDSLIGIIDKWVELFHDKIEEKTVRADSANDLATLLRVRELLLGRATQRTDHTGHVTLESIQSTHSDWRSRAIDVGSKLTDGIDGHSESEAKARCETKELPAAPTTISDEPETMLETLKRVAETS